MKSNEKRIQTKYPLNLTEGWTKKMHVKYAIVTVVGWFNPKASWHVGHKLFTKEEQEIIGIDLLELKLFGCGLVVKSFHFNKLFFRKGFSAVVGIAENAGLSYVRSNNVGNSCKAFHIITQFLGICGINFAIISHNRVNNNFCCRVFKVFYKV